MGCKEIGQIGRLKVLKCFEGQRGNFEMNKYADELADLFISDQNA